MEPGSAPSGLLPARSLRSRVHGLRGDRIGQVGVLGGQQPGRERQVAAVDRQLGPDEDPATSDGIFVHHPGGPAVAEGDTVRVTGTADEYFQMTQLSATAAAVCATDGELPPPVALELPLAEEDKERHEGMRVTLPQDLAILEYFNFGRYGEIALGTDRQFQPTAVHAPGSAEAEALAEANARHRITLDDGRSTQNPDPARHPNGEEFTLQSRFRGGDLVTDATGVLDFRFDLWRVQPTTGATVTTANPRPEAPELAGGLQVASFNVLNYFTTLGSRGADTEAELARQEAKIVAALAELDADVVGLIEIENNGDEALARLTGALNDHLGEERYAYLATGEVGTDEITTAFIYQPAEATPVGDFATLTSADDERFLDDKNRPTLAQTFRDEATGGMVTVAVNHLKSKGSSCEDVGDPTDPDGQGNCNGVRTAAAEAMADWLAGDPTGTGVEEALIIGDLNAYDKEDPIEALRAAGYTDLLLREQGEHAYSYVFDGQLGYLDHALANEALLEQVAGADVWAVNADEPSLLDYDMSFTAPPQDAIYAPDPYRSSDHDPVVVGLDLTPPDSTAPEVAVSADPATVWPPNGKQVPVTVTVAASDDTTTADELRVELVDAVATGGAVEQQTEREFLVTAAMAARYTFVYAVTDEAGNTTLADVTVEVLRPGAWPQRPAKRSN
ncbi:ExeM/NucH family extracellular endonuclease [Ornithinicoccus halotolerans]|uniref:ExeM/NucH family extracellular endonuclease n=1 Tax=Ornithinicoccus halotolerans TaxID=1748220 RepID=UPI001E401DD6|nr:ExeM/NucH family extracellular endonuclease [Ornithinicoccus halotolerans]